MWAIFQDNWPNLLEKTKSVIGVVGGRGTVLDEKRETYTPKICEPCFNHDLNSKHL